MLIFSSSPFFHLDDRRLEKGNRNCWLNLPQGRKASWKLPWMLVSICVVDCLVFSHMLVLRFLLSLKNKDTHKKPSTINYPNETGNLPFRFHFCIHLLTLSFLRSLTWFYRTDITEYIVAK